MKETSIQIGRGLAVMALTLCSLFMPATAQTADEKIAELQKTVELLTGKLESLEARQNVEEDRVNVQEEHVADLSGRFTELQSAPARDTHFDKFRLGGYGELHANFTEGKGPDQIDLHRLVVYLGYEFTDWIQFHSEWEIEHGFVTDGAGGEFVIEQAHFDFLFSDLFNVRVGRDGDPVRVVGG